MMKRHGEVMQQSQSRNPGGKEETRLVVRVSR